MDMPVEPASPQNPECDLPPMSVEELPIERKKRLKRKRKDMMVAISADELRKLLTTSPSDTSSVETVSEKKKEKKEKKKHEFTPARQAAFAKCTQIRREKLAEKRRLKEQEAAKEASQVTIGV